MHILLMGEDSQAMQSVVYQITHAGDAGSHVDIPDKGLVDDAPQSVRLASLRPELVTNR